ncbi:MAG TPA: dTDP-4-dehydrorhamnose 3,5-epimerase [Candidatus Hydrogenedentes bacterium]|nr:dTDP-4-dehydrorhamnose 3,5-epimerase [Candidatus Hydrogenedentota bacterium]
MPVKVIPTEIPDVLVIESPVFRDERGYFTEVFSSEGWAALGLPTTFVQDNLSKSVKGTLRGLHYQIEPHAQGKLVHALSGTVYDVAVDLRKGSSTFGKWVGRLLSGGSGLAMWIPAGFAHGFVALEDDSMLFYKCSSPWVRSAERSLAYDDPELKIGWPVVPTIVSPKDADAPRLSTAEFNFSYP